MLDERVIRQMSGVKDDVYRRTRDAVERIVALAWLYRYKGRAFTLDSSVGLKENADRVIGELYDHLIEDNNARIDLSYGYADVNEMLEDEFYREYTDREINGKTRQERYEGYCKMLRQGIEAWLAIGFAEKMSRTEIVEAILGGNPGMLQVARRGGGFSTSLEGPHVTRDIAKWMTLTGQNAVLDAFHFGTLESYRENPEIIGYKVMRGSSYPCSVCGDLTVGIHPITDIVLPAHPRCVCWEVPVYKGQEEMI